MFGLQDGISQKQDESKSYSCTSGVCQKPFSAVGHNLSNVQKIPDKLDKFFLTLSEIIWLFLFLAP